MSGQNLYPANYSPDQLPRLAAEDRGPKYTAIFAVFTALATIMVGLRLYARHISAWKYGWDDVFIVISLVGTWSTTISLFVSIHHGYGRHTIFLIHQLKFLAKTTFWLELSAIIVLVLTKLSVLCFYRRIFPNNYFQICTWVMTTIVSLSGVAAFILAFVHCHPFSLTFDYSRQQQCLPNTAVLGSIGVIDAVNDFIVVMMPLPLLAKMQLHLQRKLVILGMFAIGLLVTLFAALRTQFLFRINTPDYFWSDGPSRVWLVLQECFSIICASIPMLGPLLQYLPARFKPRHFQGSKPTKSHKSTDNPKYSESNRDKHSTTSNDDGAITKTVGFDSTLALTDEDRDALSPPAREARQYQHGHQHKPPATGVSSNTNRDLEMNEIEA